MPTKVSRSLAVRDPAEVASGLAATGERNKETDAWLNDVLQRAEGGDQAAFTVALTVYKEMPRLWEDNLHVLQQNLERSILDLLMPAGTHLISRAATERQITAMRAELLGEHPTPLERVLVDRIVVDWLDSLVSDTVRAQRSEGAIAVVEYRDRRSDRAHARLMRSLKTLATVRRLVVGSVQINVAEQIQQVNVPSS